MSTSGAEPPTSLKQRSQASLILSSTSSSDSLSSAFPAYVGQDKSFMALSLEELLYKDSDTFDFSVVFPESQPMDPMKLLVLASTVADVAPNYGVFKHNCYFFSKIVLDLSQTVLGGALDKLDSKKSKSGMVGGFLPLPYVLDSNPDYKKLLAEAAALFPAKWHKFEQARDAAHNQKRLAEENDQIAEERDQERTMRKRAEKDSEASARAAQKDREMRERAEKELEAKEQRIAQLEAALRLAAKPVPAGDESG